MTKIAREGIAKVTKELQGESKKLHNEIRTKFQQFYDVLQGFMGTVTEVSPS